MDLEEWDLLTGEGFIDIHENKSIPKKSNTTVIDMNYFQKFSEPHNKKNSRVIPVPIQIDHKIGEIGVPDEVIKFPIHDHDQTSKSDDHNQMIIKEKEEEADFLEPASKVFFKKLKENEFVDMKMDSPKSLHRGILPQLELGNYQFEEIEKKLEEENKQEIPTKKGDDDFEEDDDDDKFEDEEEEEEGLNVWKWAMTGIGALFSFGFAAATVSLIVLGNRHKESSKKQELYAHDKQLKQVVRHATKLNEAITVMRGVPVTRAHITIDGYHEIL